jgi:biotin synthase
MSREGQAMCFFAGANSIFAGDKLPSNQMLKTMKMLNY